MLQLLTVNIPRTDVLINTKMSAVQNSGARDASPRKRR